MPVLDVKDLSQKINNTPILKSVSIRANTNEVTVFLGPNGAGKTTLLRTIMGLLPLSGNNILLNNTTINNWPVHQRVENGLVYLPQHTSLFAQMSVLENLELVYTYHDYWKTQDKEIFEQEIKRLFEQTGLTCPFDQHAGSLSGGQKRKLETIRALLMKPRVVMLDEPFAGVDPKSVYELKQIFSDMAKNGIAVLISDHNVDQLLSIANFIYVIIDGITVTKGDVKTILSDEFTRQRYFGSQFSNEIAQRYL